MTSPDTPREVELDEMLEQLAALPSHDLDPLRTERTKARAHKVLARHRRRARRIRAAAERLYNGVLEPALVAGFAGLVLFWAFSKASLLLS